MVVNYWLESDPETSQTKLVCKMIWTDFQEPKPFKTDNDHNIQSENDSVRVCFNIKPAGSQYYDQCNFFIKEWVNKDLEKGVKKWDGVKYWIQSAADTDQFKKIKEETAKQDKGELFFKEDTEPIDPKQWCSLNWSNDMELKPSQCKLRSQEIKQMIKPWDEDSSKEYRSAYSDKRKTLTLEWERIFEPNPEEYGTLNATQIIMDQIYDIKLYYGIFNHDGEEN